MTAKMLVLSGALAISTAAFAGTKTYDIILNSPAKAGSTELQPGEYKLKVDGSQVIFSRDGKEWTAPVKVETVNRKFAQTTVESSTNQGDMDTIKAIDLGGSTTKLEFE
jgi:hypothetical protein